jgi:hypothetical protein
MRTTIFWAVLTSAILGAAPLLAQTDSTSVKAIVERMIDLEKIAQQKKDDWAAERAELQARSAALSATIAFLRDRKATDEERLAALNRTVADLERRIAEAASLGDTVRSALEELCGAIEPSVRGDLPYRVGDRQSRFDALRADIGNPGVIPAEKIRKCFDFLQTEAVYGITVEVADQRIAVGADTLVAQVLRTGRIGLYWRTPDGNRAGWFDREKGAWVELGGGDRGRIGRAVEMALRQRPIEVIALPVGRIQP